MARKRTSVIQVMITGDASDLEKATGAGGNALTTFAAVAGVAAKAVIGAVASISAASVREFAQFNQAFTESTAIMGDLSDTMRNDLADAAREVAKATTFSADEAAQAIYFLASAGLDAEQSMAALPQVAQFAQAGMFDLARATDILTDAQTALGMNSADAEENLAAMSTISDVLVRANTVANASVEQFGEALMVAGPRMRELGVSLEEGTAVLASFASAGFKGQTAGQGLAIILRDLPRAAAANAEEFANLGIQVEDAEGNFLPLANIVGQFDRALDGMSATQRAAAFDMLGITRTAANMMAMLLGTGDAITDYESALLSAGGATEEVADKQLSSFTNQLSLIGSGLADVMISIGEALAGEGAPLARLVAWFREQIPTIEQFVEDRLIPAFENFVVESERKFREFKTFFDENLREPLSEFMEEAREFGREALQPVVDFIEDIKTFGEDFAAAIEAQDPEAAGRALGDFIADVFSRPFLAAADLGQIFIDIFDTVDWEKVGKVVGENAPVFFSAMFGEMFSASNRQSAKDFLADNWFELLVGIFALGIARAALALPLLIVRGLAGAIINGFTALTAFLFRDLGAILLRFAGRLGLLILTGLGRALAYIGVGLFAVFSRVAILVSTGIANAIRAIAAALGPILASLRVRFLIAVRGFFSRLGFRLFGLAGVQIGQFFRLLGPFLLRGLASVFSGFVAAIGVWGAIAIAAIAAFLGVFIWRFRRWRDENEVEMYSLGTQIMTFWLQGLIRIASTIATTVTGFLTRMVVSVKRWIAERITDLVEIGASIIGGLVSGITGAVSGLVGAVTGAISSAIDAGKRLLGINSPSKLFEGFGENVMQGFANGVIGSAGLVDRAMSSFAGGVANVNLMPPSVPLSPAGAGPQQTVVNVTVTSADPQAVVEAIRKYTRNNGPLGQVVAV